MRLMGYDIGETDGDGINPRSEPPTGRWDMGRPRKRQRRHFGSLRTVTKHGHEYIEASYPTPLEAFSKWPNLPKRQTKTVIPDFIGEAEAWLSRAERDIKLGAWIPPQQRRETTRRESMTFGEYARRWLDGRRKADGEPIRETTKQKHREALRLYLLPFFGNTALADITAADVQRWWDTFTPYRADEGADRDARRYAVYCTLRAIMRSAATEPVDADGSTLIKATPCHLKAQRAAMRHKVVIAEIDQLQALYEAFPKWLRLYVYLSGYMGLREGECLGLQRRDVDAKNMILHVRRAAKTLTHADGTRETVLGATKTRGSVRDVRIPEFLAEPIADHLREFTGSEPTALMFTAPRTGGICTGQTLRNTFNRAKGKVPALAGMRPHDLRDTALTRLAAMGATNGELMRQAGHQTLDVASRYQHTMESHYTGVLDSLTHAVNSDGSHAPAPAGDGTGERQDATETDAMDGTATTPASATAMDATGAGNGPQAAGTDGAGRLAGVLARMPLTARLDVLRGLPTERRYEILETLDTTTQVETMRELLRETER